MKPFTELTHDPQFSRDDVARVLAETFIERVEYHPECESTNSRALQLACDDTASELRTLVITDCQTEGRGRGSNRWWSTDGALTFSVLFKAAAVLVPTSRWPQISLTTGLAVCDAIELIVGTTVPQLKWPNDVYLADRKLGGILVEATNGPRRNLVIGIGVNVNNSTRHAPADLRDTAIALSDVVGSVRRTDVLILILQQLSIETGLALFE